MDHLSAFTANSLDGERGQGVSPDFLMTFFLVKVVTTYVKLGPDSVMYADYLPTFPTYYE